MKIDLSCPVEVAKASLPSAADHLSELILFNLDSRLVTSCEVLLRLLDAKGTERARVTHRGRSLNGHPHTAFAMPVPIAPAAQAVKAEATVTKVWFVDNDVWRRQGDQETEYVSNELPLSQNLVNLRYVAGDAAVGYPTQQENVWVCVCGRPNHLRDTLCARCLRRKDVVFSTYNQENVELQISRREHQLDLRSRAVREDMNRMQREREDAYNIRRKKRRRVLRILTGIGCALLIAALAVGVVAPGVRLLSAKRQVEEGNYAAAEEALTALGAFPGAEQELSHCRYLAARQSALTSGDVSVLAEAAAELRTYADTEAEALSLAYQADYTRACLLLRSGKEAEARSLLESLPDDFEGKQEKLKACDYETAYGLLDQGLYPEAREAFLALADYEDAAEQAAACLYIPAVAGIEEGEYDAAIEALSQIEDYEDSATLIRKCYYLQGMLCEGQGDMEGAASAYIAAGDYEDAVKRYQGLVYQMAEANYFLKYYGDAKALYDTIPDYEDAAEKSVSCLLNQAQKAYNDKEYLQAASYLTELKQSNAEAAELWTKSLLQGAKAAIKRKEYQTALDCLQQIPDEKDAESLVQQATYGLANSLLDAGKPYEALPLLEKITGYKDVSSLLKKPCYLILGTWVAKEDEGFTATFRRDGSCTIHGEDFYFSIGEDKGIYTAAGAEDTKVKTHSYTTLNSGNLSLQDVREASKGGWHMKRVEESEAAAAEASAEEDTEMAESETTQTEDAATVEAEPAQSEDAATVEAEPAQTADAATAEAESAQTAEANPAQTEDATTAEVSGTVQ